ncbi:anti-sigma-F factor Fin family protein [Amphibacillus jilinensis]|uniref:anti-sigma-F factor Fin family protein n=1 Tax=Amphibacillus jilinensis TaxID=1216008 RepID=UPI00030786E3|nr:anti-sigma-F factor Fin family protein [Amphibacillus jilinensis]
MRIHYRCKHCQSTIAELNHERLNLEKLGFNHLAPEQKKSMIKYNHTGNVDVFVICESCEAALYKYPVYHEFDYFIH